MAKKIQDRYFIKIGERDEWNDITTLFDGIVVLSISGFNERGESKNVYTAEWVNSSEEDYYLAGSKVLRNNIDLSMTFIAGARYSANPNKDAQIIYDTFVNYITENGAFYIRSVYANKEANVVCLKGVKPTVVKLHRGINSYILATATLHTLRPPVTSGSPSEPSVPVPDRLLLEDGSWVLLSTN